MARGPQIRTGVKVDGRIVDVAPTILHILDVPVPSDMDRRVLTEIFKLESEPAQRKVDRQASHVSKTSVRERIEQLKTTGRLRPG
jgi:arylsulfatase A-like enzyme